MKLIRNRAVILVVLVLAILVVGPLFAPNAAPSIFDAFSEDAKRALRRSYFHLGGMDVTPILLIKSALLVIFLWFASRLTRRGVRRLSATYTSMDEAKISTVEVVVGYTVFIGGLAVGLQSAGVNLSSLAIVGGAVGVGIGFGLQTIVSNLVSGFILLVERPIKVGDRVEVGGMAGEVMRIGARATWMRANDAAVMIVPNMQLITERVMNWTAIEQRSRLALKISVGVGSDPQQVATLLVRTAALNPDVLKSPSPEAEILGLGDRGIDFELRVWTESHVHSPGRLTRDLYFAVLQSSRQCGIDTPVPQRELRKRTEPGAAPPSPPEH